MVDRLPKTRKEGILTHQLCCTIVLRCVVQSRDQGDWQNEEEIRCRNVIKRLREIVESYRGWTPTTPDDPTTDPKLSPNQPYEIRLPVECSIGDSPRQEKEAEEQLMGDLISLCDCRLRDQFPDTVINVNQGRARTPRMKQNAVLE